MGCVADRIVFQLKIYHIPGSAASKHGRSVRHFAGRRLNPTSILIRRFNLFINRLHFLLTNEVPDSRIRLAGRVTEKPTVCVVQFRRLNRAAALFRPVFWHLLPVGRVCEIKQIRPIAADCNIRMAAFDLVIGPVPGCSSRLSFCRVQVRASEDR